MSLLIRNAEVDGVRRDVLVEDGRVVASGPRPSTVVDASGGALLPGLHDHHLHLMALAAADASVDCGNSLHPLSTAPARDGWVRGTGAQESVDRHALDALRSDVPVRVQHRSGALWMLNSAALAAVAHVLDDSGDVERDGDGTPTGRLWRYDERLRPALPARPPDLAPVVARLHSFGITAVTDATPDLDPEAAGRLLELPGLRVNLLGGGTGPRKLLLRDHDLPSYAGLRALVLATRAEGRPVAVHCVSRESLLLTLAVLDEVGPVAGDRIEHAAVVPPEAAASMAGLGVAVVTQPGFLRTRGERYRRDVDAADLPHLYPYASLLSAGVAVSASSDAPFGELDPWQVLQDAASRATTAGVVLGADERVSTATALDGYLRERPGGPRRRVEPGASADLCLLSVPLAEALDRPTAEHVRLVLLGGSVVHAAD